MPRSRAGVTFGVGVASVSLRDPVIFSLRLNNDLSVAETVEAARCAEAEGFDQFWVSHDLFLRSAPVLLSAAAVATSRIKLGSCILNPYSLDVAEIAMVAATLQELSKGRFLLGVAAGAQDFLSWVGLEQRRPLTRMRESLLVLRDALSGEDSAESERIGYQGEEVKWGPGAFLRFDPLGGVAKRVPIYLGANGPKMLALAGELADGVLPLLFPPEHWSTVRPLVAEGELGRNETLGPVDVAACVWVSISNDAAAARHALAEKVAYYGHSLSPLIFERLGLIASDFTEVFALATGGRTAEAVQRVTPEMLRIGVAGDAATVTERLAPLVRAGVRHLSFGPPLGPDLVRAIEVLGRDVIPDLRRLSSA